MALSAKSLSDITAKAKAELQKSKTTKTKSKRSTKPNTNKKSKKQNKKRSIKQISKRKNNSKSNVKSANKTKHSPASKKRKLSKQETPKRKFNYDLPLEKQKKRSVIKLQTLPTGLEEGQMRAFFKQFGTVTRVCLKRNRFGRSNRYGYVEFGHRDIGSIVEKTLDCTSLYGEMISCHVVPAEKVNGTAFFKATTIEKARLNKKLENDKVRWLNAATISNLEFQFDKWHKKLISDEKAIKQQLSDVGIAYEFNGFAAEIARIKKVQKIDGDIDSFLVD